MGLPARMPTFAPASICMGLTGIDSKMKGVCKHVELFD